MMRVSILLTTFLLLNITNSFSQKYTISGEITNQASGETIFGATIIISDLNNVGTHTNNFGFYSITLKEGQHQLLFRHAGFTSKSMSVYLTKDTIIDWPLSPIEIHKFNEVEISSQKANNNITSAQMAITRLDPKEIRTIPVIFGEQDIMKTLQLTPGVKGGGEGSAGFYVRGGGADQNLILLDAAPVYNASHLLGFFSIFNSDAIKDVALYKSGIPARYGGRLSSVMDVKMREGNKKRYSATGGIGLISSRLTVEGPIVKDKGSFILSGRRSYADLFLKLSKKEMIKNSTLFFYDLNLKANYKIGEKDRIYLSGYLGRDKFGLNKEFSFDWGNKTATLRWNHIINNKLFLNTSLIYSDFDYNFSLKYEGKGFGATSRIRDYTLKQDYNYFLSKNNTLQFGISAIYHNFSPGDMEVEGSGFGINQIHIEKQHALEIGAYIQNEQKIGQRWALMYGLRYSGFNFMGKGFAYQYNKNGVLLSKKSYDNWESIKYYQGFEPRASINFIITENNSIKLGYNRIFQYIHRLSNTTTSSPTDIWVPTSNNVKPQIGDQLALGFYQNLFHNKFKISVETYYKWLQNQIDYRPNANIIFNQNIESQLVYGKGKAYGIEFQIKKTKGKLTGWFNYTLARSLRQFSDIDNGAVFPARQDRIHDINLVLVYKINKKLTISAAFVFYTGDAVTYPSAFYSMGGYKVPYVGKRNSNRLPNYHRLDIGLTWYLKEYKHFEQSLNFSIYNVYGRENAYSISFTDHFKDYKPGHMIAVQTALFKFVPSITYNFKIK